MANILNRVRLLPIPLSAAAFVMLMLALFAGHHGTARYQGIITVRTTFFCPLSCPDQGHHHSYPRHLC